jgi:AmiR/NasT family two-component response regulator
LLERLVVKDCTKVVDKRIVPEELWALVNDEELEKEELVRVDELVKLFWNVEEEDNEAKEVMFTALFSPAVSASERFFCSRPSWEKR